MKSVLISIQPKWCDLIANGKKTVEVRKTKPKLETPFKVYIYCTQGDALAVPCLNAPKYTIHRMNNGTSNGRQLTAKEREKSDYSFANGKVIGEFVCDKIENIEIRHFTVFGHENLYTAVGENPDNQWLKHSCLSYDEVAKYGKHAPLYGWHISDLVIYDKPKELSEFQQCHKCKHNCARTSQNVELCKYHRLTRPPQSWCYVEMIGGGENDL